ncbi:MAG: hypothetical protein FWF73_07500 [Spirochaetes bacterium]|nr:hypothetical protein [Spirochaetota bacterium]
MKKFICAVSIMAVAAISGSNAIGKKFFNANDVKDIAKTIINMSFGSGPNGPFDVKKTTNKDATLVIQNDTDRVINVKAKGPTNKSFTVNSGKSSSAIVKPGRYNFVATAQGTSGCEGDVTLEGYNEYTWIFVIRK